MVNLASHGQNPYSGRLKSNNGKAATSSSLQHAPKRQKLNHYRGDTQSKFFSTPQSEPRTRRQRTLSASPPRPGNATDAIVIDEDDTPDLNGSSSKPDTLTTSSPDPMDIIREPAYSFDPSKPSPIHQFSSSLEELRGSPADGESTARLRHMNQAEEPCPPSGSKAPVSPIVVPSAQTDRPLEKGRVKKLANIFEAAVPVPVPCFDLRTVRERGRKEAMKPKQVSLPAPQSVVPQPSELRVPAEGFAITHYDARSARHSVV